ncbi:MAG: ubiquitin [Oscillospiraceae bacterium]|jgi:hypothetical protein|nr:ubiquitin [Oscillospiraceae bacterium]
MVSLDQVEKLREKANVTFEEAKDALERSGGDMLDAVIYLEQQGKTIIPPGGGRWGGSEQAGEAGGSGGGGEGGAKARRDGTALLRRIGKLFLKLFNLGCTNYLDVTRNGETVLSCPVIVLAVLLIFFFWVVVPVMVVCLFCGFRYRLRGRELGRDDVNNVMDKLSDKAAEAVDELKKTLGDETQ